MNTNPEANDNEMPPTNQDTEIVSSTIAESSNNPTSSVQSIDCECEEDPLLSIDEVFDEMNKHYKERKAEARELLGGQDDSVCTYPEGYKPRQPIYVCHTCTPEPKQAGICYGCAQHCHEGHTVEELYTKRKFKCDCGNSLFGDKKCSLWEEKSSTNKDNIYNHNFNGRFCFCDKPYDDPERPEEAGVMVQCVACEDWYHPKHLELIEENGATRNLTEAETTDGVATTLVCNGCARKMPFLKSLAAVGKVDHVVCFSMKPAEVAPSTIVVGESSEVTSSNSSENVGIVLLLDGWRNRLCKCGECMKMYEKLDCEYLLDEEDDMKKYVEDNMAKTADEVDSDDEEELIDVRAAVKQIGMDGTAKLFKAVDNFKNDLTDFLKRKAEEQSDVTSEDVQEFFADMRRKRLRKEPEVEEKDVPRGFEQL